MGNAPLGVRCDGHLELFNLDAVVEDEEAGEQGFVTGHVLLVEGTFDVAKLLEAGVKNVVASLGSQLSPQQAKLLKWAKRYCGGSRVLVLYDRDEAGRRGAAKAVELLKETGLEASAFDWEQTFQSSRRPAIPIPDTVKDPGDLTAGQVRWLRENRVIQAACGNRRPDGNPSLLTFRRLDGLPSNSRSF